MLMADDDDGDGESSGDGDGERDGGDRKSSVGAAAADVVVANAFAGVDAVQGAAKARSSDGDGSMARRTHGNAHGH
jgi:hypothetical protein